MENPSDGADLTAYVDQLEAERDALQDELADANNAMLKRFDERAAQSTDLYTWIDCLLTDRDRYKKLVEAGEGRIRSIVDEDLRRQVEQLKAELKQWKIEASKDIPTAFDSDPIDVKFPTYADLRKELDSARAEILSLKNDLENLASGADPPLHALDAIWELFSEKYGDWEYPGQAARIVSQEVTEMRAQIASQVEMLYRGRDTRAEMQRTIERQKVHIQELMLLEKK